MYGSFALTKADQTADTAFNNFIFTVDNIEQDAWTNNVATGSGDLAMNVNATIISTTASNG